MQSDKLKLVLVCGLISGLAIAAPGCWSELDFGPCGLVCPERGLLDGNPNISGVVSIDKFFGAIIDVRAAALDTSATVRVELEGMAVSLGIEGYADLSLHNLTAAVSAELDAKFEAALAGGLQITAEPVRCGANIELALQAAAECDGEVDPSTIQAHCQGWCEVSAEVAAACEATGVLVCTGQAPDFACPGSCVGACQLAVAAGCEGSCRGTCEGECSSCTGGSCTTDIQGAVTNCNGSCSAKCQGTCELAAGGTCSGRCEGACTYSPVGSCLANATTKCDVSAMSEVECQGKCEQRDVELSGVSDECEASVSAKSKASVECTPPSLAVRYQLRASLDADAQAEFRIWLNGFERRFSAMLAASAKLEGIEAAADGLITANQNHAFADTWSAPTGSESIRVFIGMACAASELQHMGAALHDATTATKTSVSTVTRIAASVGA